MNDVQINIFRGNQKEKIEEEYLCILCLKKFYNFSQFHKHQQNFHNQKTKRGRPKVCFFKQVSKEDKMKCYDNQKYNIESKILTFCASRISSKESFSKYKKKTIYIVNQYIRTPIQPRINLMNMQLIQKNSNWQKLNKEILEVFKLSQQYQDITQLTDPMQLSSNCLDYSLNKMQNFIPKCKKEIELEAQQFSIFLVWVSVYFKKELWNNIYYVLGQLYNYMLKQFEDKDLLSKKDTWLNFFGNYYLKNQFLMQIKCQINNFQLDFIIKFIQIYKEWVFIFQLVT